MSAPLRNGIRLALLSSLAPALEAGVLVVATAAGPGVDATSIQDAVAMAVEGDTILVRDGVYDRFTVTGKSLVVVAEGSDASVWFNPGTNGQGAAAIVVEGLDAGQEVVVRGLRTNYGVRVEDCTGAVWFDSVTVDGAPVLALCTISAVAGAHVEDAALVTFTGCTLVGEEGNTGALFGSGLPGDGLFALRSTAQLYDTRVLGGPGGGLLFNTAQEGAPGLRLQQSDVLTVGCSIEGGPGGRNGSPICSVTHATGGPGVRFASLAGSLSSVATTAVGGALDLEPMCPGQTGPAGPPIQGNGTIVPLAGFPRFLETDSPVRGGDPLRLTARGQPGELPVVFLSRTHSAFDLPALSGALLIGLPPEDTLVLPTTDASGTAWIDLPVPNVGAALGALTYYAQALFVDPSAGLWLGGGCTLTLVDGTL